MDINKKFDKEFSLRGNLALWVLVVASWVMAIIK